MTTTDPKLVIKLIKTLEQDICCWLEDLEQIRQQIQTIYQEGPILEAWLESNSGRIIKDVNCQENKARIDNPDPVNPSTRIHYRICSLDDDNQVHTRPCNPEQLADVSMAIARYQKLRLLLQNKEKQEQKLQQLAESLKLIHNNFRL